MKRLPITAIAVSALLTGCADSAAISAPPAATTTIAAAAAPIASPTMTTEPVMTAAPAGKEYSVARRVGDIDISFSFTLEEYYAGEGRGDYTLACGRDGEIFESIAFDSYMFPSERTVRFTDFTFDGIPDLCVDINKAADNVTTRLFVWDADSEMFRESEVLVGSRWGFEPDRRLMSVYTSAGPGAGDYAVYRWNDGAFETVRRAYIKTSPEGGFTRVFVSLADRIGDGYEDREYEYLKLGDPDIGAIIYGGL